MTVKEIVEKYLRDGGFGGLYDDWDCGCEIDDLMPCGEPKPSCVAGYRLPCDCGDHDFHIGGKP